MAVLKKTTFEILTEHLRWVLQEIAQLDVDLGFPSLRDAPHAELRKILDDATNHGYTEAELLESVISREEGQADFEAENLRDSAE
jgi:hypothetical protein